MKTVQFLELDEILADTKSRKIIWRQGHGPEKEKAKDSLGNEFEHTEYTYGTVNDCMFLIRHEYSHLRSYKLLIQKHFEDGMTAEASYTYLERDAGERGTLIPGDKRVLELFKLAEAS